MSFLCTDLKTKNISLKAPAKINLSLDVLGKRKDGYHDLAMVMQTVGLCDNITIDVTKKDKSHSASIRICATGEVPPGFPLGDTNLAYRAAGMFFKETGSSMEDHFSKITIDKHIPMAAGLAGGSTDAAAVLLGLNSMLKDPLPMEKLLRMGATLGADIPFCIHRGTCLCEGIGDDITGLPALPFCHIILAVPPIGISTKDVYEKFDHVKAPKGPDTVRMVKAISDGDLEDICHSLGNVLEYAVFPEHPIIEGIRSELSSLGALGALMSGSGSCVFGIFDDEDKASLCLSMMREMHPDYSVNMTVPTE